MTGWRDFGAGVKIGWKIAKARAAKNDPALSFHYCRRAPD